MSILNFWLDLLFPKKCYGCNQNDTWLCPVCFSKLRAYQGELPRALKNNRDLIIAGEYQDKILNDLIRAFKFDFNKELALPLFSILKKTLDQKILIDTLTAKPWNNVLIVPIPLHKKRLKWRGFNQSELLAREISNYYKWPLRLELVKIRKTVSQAELKEVDRLNNQVGVFNWTGQPIKQTILLVDDVITSGATVNEAELVLQAAGAKRVIKVALAKG